MTTVQPPPSPETSRWEPFDMDSVFKALADPSRRSLLDSLNHQNGQNLNDLCARLPMARQSVTKHLEILVKAQLVVVRRHGRERLHFLNAAPIGEIADRWIDQYQRQRVDALTNLKNAIEGTPMQPQPFVYTTYIRTTPEHLWANLTDPEFTKQYWNIDFETDWKPGSPMVWNHHGVKITDPGQRVLESDPFRRLSYTWHEFVPELGEHFGIPTETLDKINQQRRTKVTFEIEEVDAFLKLTVIHDGFDPDSPLLDMVSQGWPRVIAALKTLIETGTVV